MESSGNLLIEQSNKPINKGPTTGTRFEGVAADAEEDNQSKEKNAAGPATGQAKKVGMTA